MYTINEIKDFKYITFPSLEKHNDIFHCFTTRAGGVSEGPFSSMNIGFGTGDSSENVKKNMEIMINRLKLDIDNIVETHQTHTNNCVYVTEEHKGKVLLEYSQTGMKDIDGIYTDKKNITLMSFHADCTPIFLYDPVKRVIGLAHAGWRGTVQNIGGIMIRKFKEMFNSDPKDIIAAIGPSLCQNCFEVDEDVKDLFLENDKHFNDFMIQKGVKYHFDLWEINKYLLLKEGLDKQNIEISGACTKCRNDLFFSHRGQGGKRGLMAGLIMMK